VVVWLALILAALLLAGWLAAAWETKTVVLVRHAEKEPGDTTDPGLSPAGSARAERLARMLSDASVDAIFVSQYRRTQQTAQPLAAALGLQPVVVPAEEQDRLVELLRVACDGVRVVVVGHSNTLPAIAVALGARLGPVDEADYGGFWVVTVSRLRGTQALTLRY
jgi:broad specificity phosphatase PhoE